MYRGEICFLSVFLIELVYVVFCFFLLPVCFLFFAWICAYENFDIVLYVYLYRSTFVLVLKVVTKNIIHNERNGSCLLANFYLC